jgi:hypothetical protein
MFIEAAAATIMAPPIPTISAALCIITSRAFYRMRLAPT